jgi:hypothetical protein
MKLSHLRMVVPKSQLQPPKTKADNKNSQKPKRKKLPDHLPREENILNPDPECPSEVAQIFVRLEKIAQNYLNISNHRSK